MTRMPLVTAAPGISGADAMGLLAKHKIEKLPLVDDDRPAARADHGQGLHQVRAVPARHQGRCRPVAGRRGRRILRRGLEAGDEPGRGRGRPARRRHRPRSFARGRRHGAPAQGRPGRGPRRRRRRQRRDPRGRPVADRRRCRRRQGRGRPGLDLYDAGGGRGRRTAGHRDLRRRPGLPRGRRAGDRRRRAAVLRRHRQGAGRRWRHGDAGLAARRLRGEPGRAGLHQRQAVQGLPRHGFARRDAEPRAAEVVLQGPLLPGRRRPPTTS